MSNIDEANELCQQIYGQSYHEVFGFDSTEFNEIEANIAALRGKLKFVKTSRKQSKEKSSFLQIWRSYWCSIIVDQPIVCELYAMCAISQLLKRVRVIKSGGVEDDIRINPCIIVPSGTGKSEGNDALATFAHQVGLTYTTVDRYNDASLVGSVNKQAIEWNIKHNKKEGQQGWLDPDEKGILRKSDFVVFDEGENILKTTKDTEGAQRYLQKAMNRYGSEGNYISNTLVGYEVGGHPSCSAVITSYYLDEFQETLLDRGLLQRMIVLIQNENYELRTNIIKSIIGSIPTFEDNPDETLEYIAEIRSKRDEYIQTMREEALKLKDFHATTRFIVAKKDAIKVMDEGISQIRNLMPFMTGQKQIWESMVTRMAVNLLKLSAVHAMIHYRTFISVDDVRYATNIMMQCMTSVGFFLKENVTTESDKKTMNLRAALRKKHVGEKHTFEAWIDLCMREFSISKVTASTLMTTLLENGKMKEMLFENKKVYLIE